MNAELILAAYQQGIFPMAEDRESDYIRWVRPDYRGILLTHLAHVPTKLRQVIRKQVIQQQSLHLTASRCFREVMLACSETKPGRETTWINDAILDTYCELAEDGHAQSIEVWQGDALVGGLYGVHIGGAFFGESMFSRASNTSKIAMTGLLACLQGSGIPLLDTQFWTPHLSQFGVDEVPDGQYQALLEEALAIRAPFQSNLAPHDLQEFLDRLAPNPPISE